MLVAKYGKPTTRSTRDLQNRYGAKFVSIDAKWDRGEDSQVMFWGILGTIEDGTLLIGTKAGLAERRARNDRAVNGGQKPL